jgi:hypothetical protein
MKTIFRHILCVFLNSLLLTNLSFAQDTLKQNDKVVIGWLQQMAIAIKYVEAGNGFADLQPFKTILKDVKVLGLGETTHGTREFFQFKHRLFEFLAIKMGFTVLPWKPVMLAASPSMIMFFTAKGIGQLFYQVRALYYGILKNFLI